MTAIRTLHHRYSARRDGDGRCKRTARTAERTIAEAFAGRERQQHLLQEALMIDVFTGAGKPLRRPLLRAQKKSSVCISSQGYTRFNSAASVVLPEPQRPSMATIRRFFSADMASMRALILRRICSTLMSVLMFGALPEL